MSQVIIGLGNKARHGKDSFVTAIEIYYAKQSAAARQHGLTGYRGLKIQRLAFADALYKEVNKFLESPDGKVFLAGGRDFSIDGKHINLPEWVVPTIPPLSDARAPYGKHPKLLQWWGTEFRRQQDSEYWIKKWRAGIDTYADIVLSPDMRFNNEAKAVKDVGGVTVRVIRLNLNGSIFQDPSRDSNHVSEVELDSYNFDYQITVKTGDLALLDEWAITLVHYLRVLAKKGKP